MKCKLCKKYHSDNVGSHIFTESIIRTAFNQEGKLKRLDKEIIFESSSTHLGIEYIGRSVSLEKDEKLKKLTDENLDISKQYNPFINRDLVCRSCENKFGIVESVFCDKVYSKIISRNNITETYISFENDWLLSLQFVIINIWRVSASDYDNFKLNEFQEEYLREFILKTSNENLQLNLSKSNDLKREIEKFHFAIVIFQQDNSDLTENGVIVENYDNSYFILLNRFSIIFNFQKLNENKLPKLLSGIMEENLKIF